MTDSVDAIGYGDQLRKQLQRSLIEAGHSACRHNENARYDFERSLVLCGCGHEVQLVGGQPARPQDSTPGTALDRVGPRDPVAATLATIDPTIAYTPVDLEMRILDVLARLEQGAVFERQAIDTAARLELAWKKAYWIAKNASEAGAADRREADAMVQTLELYEEHLKAGWVAKAVKATMHNLRAILSGYQSVTRSVTADFQAGGPNR